MTENRLSFAPLWFKKDIAPEITGRAKGTTTKQLDDWWFHMRNLSESKALECVLSFFRGYQSKYIARPNDFAQWLKHSGMSVHEEDHDSPRFKQEIPKWPSGLVVIASWYIEERFQERVGWLVRRYEGDEGHTWECRNRKMYHGSFSPRQARRVQACFTVHGEAPAEWLSGCPEPVGIEKYIEMLTPEEETCW